MTAKWEKGEGNQGVLTVDVDAKEFNAAIDQAFDKVKKTVNVPGFRKGKVPRQLFESRFGVESLYQDALDILLPKAYSEAVEETGIEPVDQPEIDIKEMEKGKTLIFTANVVVKPEVELGEYKGLEVPKFDTTVNDEDVNKELESLREKHAELVVVEDDAAKDGDTLVFDFEGFVDGEPFEGGKSENYSLEIGSGQFIPGFEEELVGAKSGEEKDVNVTFPEEYHAADLAGKPAVFKVKVHEVKRKELPTLDDEFAKDVDEDVETLDELKAKKKEQLQKDKEHEKEHHDNDAVVEKATENATVDIPDGMIKTETDRMMQEMEQRFQSQGISMDMYYQMAGTDAEGMKEQFKPEAEKRVRMNLVLEAIAVAENLEASDERVEEELDKMAEMYQREKDEIRQLLAMQGGVEALKGDLRIQTAVDFLVEQSVKADKIEENSAE
ncbi:trigger factor [Bacillaceae bacterium JMAK1]|nr:trigger factor [Bacillaceae bacterium JMAK1]